MMRAQTGSSFWWMHFETERNEDRDMTHNTDAIAFHELGRIRPRSRWFHGLLTGLLGIAMYLAMMIGGGILVAIIAMTIPGASDAVGASLETLDMFDLSNPWLMLILLVPLILMIPPLLLASRIVQGRGVGFLTSVTARMRWRWLGKTLALAFGVFAVGIGASIALAAVMGQQVTFNATNAGIPLMLVIVLLFVPFQAAAEEYVFRGYLMQLIGGWLRHPAFAILLPVPLFILGHGYDIWGAISVGIFAVIAGWLCWRTGGLEAAISAHIANNVLLFVFASFSLTDANATEGSPIDVVLSAAMLLVYSAIVVRWTRRDNIARTATAPAPPVTDDQAASSSSASMIV